MRVRERERERETESHYTTLTTASLTMGSSVAAFKDFALAKVIFPRVYP